MVSSSLGKSCVCVCVCVCACTRPLLYSKRPCGLAFCACWTLGMCACVCVCVCVCAHSYVEGVRANILAGGDNASRAVLLGALLAAQV